MQRTRTSRMVAVIALAISSVWLVVPTAHAQDPLEAELAEAIDVPVSSQPNPVSSRKRADDPSQSAGRLVGSIRIPSIELDEAVRGGVALAVIDQGPAHWVGTASPGQTGNVVLAGHRTTHSAPFRYLDRLEEGDLIYLTDAWGFEVMYRVSHTFIVEPRDVWITYDTPDAVLTMFACHPLGSAAQRIVVRADLVAGRRIA